MKILILSNLVSYTYNFRKELIDALVERGDSVVVAADNDDDVKTQNLGCRFIEVPFDGKGTNIKKEIKLLSIYRRIIKQEDPDAVLSFTIKMNLYGGIICRLKKVPFFPMITGLGELEKNGKLRTVLLAMHRFVMPKAVCVFFQNESNRQFFKEMKIGFKDSVVVPGSGINLEKFYLQPYPAEEPLSFAFIGRVTEAKGIAQYLDAAESLEGKGYKFYVAGKCDTEYEKRIAELDSNGIIEYAGNLSDTRPLMRKVHCVVVPTFHPEGMNNVLLETGATGRPSICTGRVGCAEIVDDKVTGLFCKAGNSDDLQRAVNEFVRMSYEEKLSMGFAARAKIEKSFDRSIVVKAYLERLIKESEQKT